jgi:TRAP-type C4-dicarboxylate transport system permease small subunit
MWASFLNRFDGLMAWLGDLSGWLFFATGAMLTYEVLARYVFSAPTIWAAEISQMFLIWGMYLALPRTVLRDDNITIEVLHELLPGWAQRACDLVAMAFMLFFCGVVLWYGWDIAWDSFTRGRSTGTMLNIPNWWTEMVIPFGFGLAVLACIVRLIELMRGAAQGKSTGEGTR